MSHPNVEELTKYLQPLVGATIEKVEAHVDEDDDFGEAWPRIYVTLPGEKEQRMLEVSRDEEGNGPGFIFGLDIEVPAK